MQLVTKLYLYQELQVVLNQDIPRLSLCSCVKSGTKYNVIFNRWTKTNNKGFFNTTGLGTNICLA